MSMKTGGPAFPEVRIRSGDNYNAPVKIYYGGMTMRDWFAGKAMQALIAHYGDKMHIGDSDGRTSLHFAAYDHADNMLKAREA